MEPLGVAASGEPPHATPSVPVQKFSDEFHGGFNGWLQRLLRMYQLGFDSQAFFVGAY